MWSPPAGGPAAAPPAAQTYTGETTTLDSMVDAVVNNTPPVYQGVTDKTSDKSARNTFTGSEVGQLRQGVRKHGAGNWAKMLSDPSLRFNPHRSSVSLKDKWRNLTQARNA